MAAVEVDSEVPAVPKFPEAGESPEVAIDAGVVADRDTALAPIATSPPATPATPATPLTADDPLDRPALAGALATPDLSLSAASPVAGNPDGAGERRSAAAVVATEGSDAPGRGAEADVLVIRRAGGITLDRADESVASSMFPSPAQVEPDPPPFGPESLEVVGVLSVFGVSGVFGVSEYFDLAFRERPSINQTMPTSNNIPRTRVKKPGTSYKRFRSEAPAWLTTTPGILVTIAEPGTASTLAAPGVTATPPCSTFLFSPASTVGTAGFV
ncbi:MAG: hypothetical protein WA888_06210 [Burkholderiaceae bacterium]